MMKWNNCKIKHCNALHLRQKKLKKKKRKKSNNSNGELTVKWNDKKLS